MKIDSAMENADSRIEINPDVKFIEYSDKVCRALAIVYPSAKMVGMGVSVDVSTGEHDAFNRLFGEVIEVSESKGKPVLCVEVKGNNFQGDQVAEKDSRGDL